VVGLAGLVEPRDRGLEDPNADALRGERAGDRRGDDGLADLGAGAGDEDARQGSGGEGGNGGAGRADAKLAGAVAHQLGGLLEILAAMGGHHRETQP
jgi:hypothetical protein